jgi:hypothetical protein
MSSPSTSFLSGRTFSNQASGFKTATKRLHNYMYPLVWQPKPTLAGACLTSHVHYSCNRQPPRHFADRTLTTKMPKATFWNPPCRQICFEHTNLTWRHESNGDWRIRRIQLNSNDKEWPTVVNLIGTRDKALQIIISQVLN